MTYNTHGCRGTDGVLDMDRIARVAARQRPDLLALQELDVSCKRSLGVDQCSELGERLGMHAHFTCASRRSGGQFGIAMLATEKLSIEFEACLPARRDEVRAAQWLRLRLADTEVDVLNTHLSVRAGERHTQLRALLGGAWLERRFSHPHLVLCGDLNAVPFSWVYRALGERLRDVQRACPGKPRATWPSRWPVARIDHIFVGRGFDVLGCAVPSDDLARAASDHLPLVADLQLVETEACAP